MHPSTAAIARASGSESYTETLIRFARWAASRERLVSTDIMHAFRVSRSTACRWRTAYLDASSTGAKS